MNAESMRRAGKHGKKQGECCEDRKMRRNRGSRTFSLPNGAGSMITRLVDQQVGSNLCLRIGWPIRNLQPVSQLVDLLPNNVIYSWAGSHPCQMHKRRRRWRTDAARNLTPTPSKRTRKTVSLLSPQMFLNQPFDVQYITTKLFTNATNPVYLHNPNLLCSNTSCFW